MAFAVPDLPAAAPVLPGRDVAPGVGELGPATETCSDGGVIVSPCGRFRWLAWRVWSPAPVLLVVVARPGGDPRRPWGPRDGAVARRASLLGFGGVEIAAADAALGRAGAEPDDGGGAPDQVGSGNDAAIRGALGRSALVACAWGRRCSLEREEAILDMIAAAGHDPHVFGIDSEGRPLDHVLASYGAPLLPLGRTDRRWLR